MRIFYIFILSFLSLYVDAQSQQQYLGAPNTKIIVRGKMQADSGFSVAVDTLPSADNGSISSKSGVFYVRNGDWKRVSPIINIKEFGAKGDGITDDASALKTAFNIPGIVIYMPAGTYRTSSIVGLNTSKVKIYGDGSDKTKIISDTLVTKTLYIADNVSYISMDNLSIENQDTIKTSLSNRGVCLSLFLDSAFSGSGTRVDSNLSFSNMKFTGAKGTTDGVFFVVRRNNFGGKLYNVVFDKCEFSNIGAAGLGVLTQYDTTEWVRNFSVRNCLFQNTGMSPILTNSGGFGASMSGNMVGLSFDHNTVINWTDIGIEFDGPSNSSITNNYFVGGYTKVQTKPYSVNYSQVTGRGKGYNNVSSGNIQKDSSGAMPDIINQVNYKSSNNILKSFVAYAYIYNSLASLNGDSYTCVSDTNFSLWLRGTSIVQGNSISVNSSPTASSIIKFSDGANGNIFENGRYNGSGMLIAMDGSSKGNIIRGLHNGDRRNIYSNNLLDTGKNVMDLDSISINYQGSRSYTKRTNVNIQGNAHDTTITSTDDWSVINSKSNPGNALIYGHNTIFRQTVAGGSNVVYIGNNSQLTVGTGDTLFQYIANNLALSNPQGILSKVVGYGGYGGALPNIGDVTYFQAPNITGTTSYISYESLAQPGANIYSFKVSGGAKTALSQTGIGTNTPSSNAILDVTSNSQGILFPRMTNTQRDAIFPTEGLIIYSLTDHAIEFYNGTIWKQITTN